jgi:DNA-binding CsgD family transcriptional regulator
MRLAARPRSLHRLRSDIEALSAAELPAARLRMEAAERLRNLIPVDGFCVSSADPDSLLITATDAENIEPSLAGAFYENEYAQRDFAKHEQLIGSRRRVRVLAQETEGEPRRSQRYRRIVRPMGFHHELRAALVERGTAWGFVHLYRRAERCAFAADEVAALERAAAPLASGLRAAAGAGGGCPLPSEAAPAVLLLAGDDRLLGSSGPLERWLGTMRDPLRTTPGPVPEVVHSVASSTRRRDLAGDRRGATARVQAADGSWWTVHGSVAEEATARDGTAARPPAPGGRTGSGPAGWEVTVIVAPASGGELTGMMMSSLRLSPGERAVCERLLAGLPTKLIAAEMSLSTHTVEDRLKVIFAKAGVASRQELVARLNPAGTPR